MVRGEGNGPRGVGGVGLIEAVEALLAARPHAGAVRLCGGVAGDQRIAGDCGPLPHDLGDVGRTPRLPHSSVEDGEQIDGVGAGGTETEPGTTQRTTTKCVEGGGLGRDSSSLTPGWG